MLHSFYYQEKYFKIDSWIALPMYLICIFYLFCKIPIKISGIRNTPNTQANELFDN